MAGSSIDVTHEALHLAEQLPILTILVPFVAAPLIAVIGSRRFAMPIAFIACFISFIMSLFLAVFVADGSQISYELGGWEAPFGIEYRIDAVNALLLCLISGVATLVVPYASRALRADVAKRHLSLIYACFMLTVVGLIGIVITADAFNVFVFLEISSLSTYVLIALGADRDKRALTSSYDYLIMGTIGATFFVIGIGLIYMVTGTLNMADIADRLQGMGDNRSVQAAFAFIIVGLSLKVAIFPLHHWLPNAYTYAPTAFAAFLAATATKAAIYVMIRFIFSVFGPAFDFTGETLIYIFVPFALLAMFVSSLVAVFQDNLKRMLAYSSIGHIGYMLLGIVLLSETGLTATLAHLVNHGIAKAALFMGVGLFMLHRATAYYGEIAGLGKNMPLTGAAMVVAGLSLIGVPGTAGFLSKWVLVEAAFERGWWWLAALIVLSSLLAVAYVWRMIEALYFQESGESGRLKEPLAMIVPAWILAGASIWLGFDTSTVLHLSDVGAGVLFEGTFSLSNDDTPAQGGTT